MRLQAGGRCPAMRVQGSAWLFTNALFLNVAADYLNDDTAKYSAGAISLDVLPPGGPRLLGVGKPCGCHCTGVAQAWRHVRCAGSWRSEKTLQAVRVAEPPRQGPRRTGRRGGSCQAAGATAPAAVAGERAAPAAAEARTATAAAIEAAGCASWTRGTFRSASCSRHRWAFWKLEVSAQPRSSQHITVVDLR